VRFMVISPWANTIFRPIGSQFLLELTLLSSANSQCDNLFVGG
jgi:hypothetical protein